MLYLGLSPLPAITPFVTEEAYTIPYGYSCEAEFRFEASDYGNSKIEAYWLTVAPTFGLRENFNVLLKIPVEYARLQGTGLSNKGIGDVDLGFKYLVAKEALDRPAVALNLDIIFGLADKDKVPARGTQEEDVSISVSLGKKIRGNIGFDFNVGFTRVGADYLDDIITYSADLTVPLNEYNWYLLELYGNTNVNPDQQNDPLSAFLGFRHITYRDLELSIGASFGVTTAAPDWGLTGGMYYDF